MSRISLFSRLAWTTGLFLACFGLDGRARSLAAGFTPGITVGSRFDERHSTFVDAGQWVGSIAPQFLFELSGPVSSWELSALRSYESYSYSGTLTPATDVASLRGSGAPGEYSQLSLAGNYVRSKDLFYLAPGVPLPSGQTEIASGSAGGQFQLGEGDYQIRSVNHQATGLADGLAQAWSAAIFPLRNEYSRLLVRWAQRDFWLDRSSALRTTAATVGYHRDHSPVLSTQLEVGLADTRDMLHGTNGRDLAVSAEVVGLGRALGLPVDMQARITHDSAITGMAQLWRSVANSWVAIRWERSLDAEGGLFTEPTLRDLFKFEARDTIGGRTIAALDGSFARTRNRVEDGLRVDNRNASASLSRVLQPWLTARAAYYFSRQTEYRDLATQDSWRSRAELTVNAALQ